MLLQLLALGLLLHAGRALLVRGGLGPAEEVALGASTLAVLRAEAAAALGRAPSPDELEALVEEEVAEELLYREALARGLDREDEVVRRRLAADAAFLRGEPGAERTRAEALYREALALGLDRTDVVVRRRLVQRVRMELEAEARAPEPSEAELRGWYAAHAGRLEAPARVAFRHVFFDAGRRGEAGAEAAARAARAALAGGAGAAGDPSLVPAEEPLRSERWTERLLGPGFAAALAGAPLGVWWGPVRSSLGWHAVRVDAREPARTPAFEDARAQVRDALLAERGAEAVRRFVAQRRARALVRVGPGT
jgi:parvulin-like peptidyl-prolyl isomerase